MPRRHRPRPARPAFAPADVFTVFARHLSEGNLGEVMAMYEPEATYITAADAQKISAPVIAAPVGSPPRPVT